jgi:hypothetical protein
MPCNRWNFEIEVPSMIPRVDPLCLDPVLNPALRPKPAPADERWIVGLDLGQAVDFTAMVVLHRTTVRTEAETYRVYACRHIRRWPLGSTYDAIVADLKTMLAKLPERPTLVVDATGCGRPVCDMIRKASLPVRSLSAVVITAGAHEGRVGAVRTVPKRDLVGAVMAVMHKGRLHIAKSLPETETLVKELRSFTARITTAGNEKYEAGDWRVSPHDDLILALALALEHDRAGHRLSPESFYFPPPP